MSLITTPRSLIHRAELYQRLSQLIAAGLGILQALEAQAQSPPSRHWRAPLGVILGQIQDGQTLSQGMAAAGGVFSEFELAICRAAEESGRLAESFLQLARHYQDAAALARQFLSSIAYPVLVFHMAIFIFPMKTLQGLILGGSVGPFVMQKVMILAPLYALVWGVAYLCQEKLSRAWRAIVEAFLAAVPVLGPARHSLAVARLAAALEAMLGAGVPIVQAWAISAPASGSLALVKAVNTFLPSLESGATPAEALRQCRAFPQTFVSHYATGEASGKLDESLRWLHLYYHEEGTRKLRRAVALGGSLLYAGVVLLVAWQVLSFYIGYFKQINDAIP